MFETLIIQPILNLLILIYSLVPGNDFGVAVIIFTAMIRFAMWPMLRKQLHHTKLMRELQPEIKKVKEKAGGDRQQEAQMMMALYKEKGISPFSSIGLLLVQLPVFIGLFAALRSLESPARLISMPYSFIRGLGPVESITSEVANQTNEALSQVPTESLERLGLSANEAITSIDLRAIGGDNLEVLYNEVLIQGAQGGAETVQQTLVHGPFFDQHLFGVIDLSRRALEANMPIYVPLLLIAIFAGIVQYIQTKQLANNRGEETKARKGIKEILRDSAQGKEPDQSEINAAVGSKMSIIFAPLIAYISAISLGGLAVYFATSGLVGYIQQRFVLNQDVDEMEKIADQPNKGSGKKSSKRKESKAEVKVRTYTEGNEPKQTKNKKNRSKSSASKRNKKKR